MQKITFMFGLVSLMWLPASWAVTECSQGNLTRSVSVVYADPGQPVPCEVLYEKPTEQQTMTLWRAQNEAGYCEARAREFVAKLQDLGWDCAENSASLEPETEPEPEPVNSEANSTDN